MNNGVENSILQTCAAYSQMLDCGDELSKKIFDAALKASLQTVENYKNGERDIGKAMAPSPSFQPVSAGAKPDVAQSACDRCAPEISELEAVRK